MGRRKAKGKGAARQGGKSSASSQLFVAETNAISHGGSTYDNFSPSFQWTTRNDVVYGVISKGPHSPNQPPSKIFGQVTPSLPAAMNEPFSMQWEYEFSPNIIVKTSGGNDSDAANGDGMFREVITGKFAYRNGKISGFVDSVAASDYTVFSGTYHEEINIYTANTPVNFTGFRGLGKAIANRASNPSVFTKKASYRSDPAPQPDWVENGWWAPSDRTIVEVNGFGDVLANNWWTVPFSTNLV